MTINYYVRAPDPTVKYIMASAREKCSNPTARNRSREAHSPEESLSVPRDRSPARSTNSVIRSSERARSAVTPVVRASTDEKLLSVTEHGIHERFSERLLAPYNLTRDPSSEEGSTQDVGGAEVIRRPSKLSRQLCYNVPSTSASSHCSFHPLKFTFEHPDPALPIEAWHCYRLEVQPTANFQTDGLTTIYGRDGRRYSFEGFSLLSACPLDTLPSCQFNRYNIQYSINLIPDQPPQCCIQDVAFLRQYLFECLLEMYDWVKVLQHHCEHFHFVPRFIHHKRDDRQEILPLSELLNYLLESFRPLERQPSWGSKGTEEKGSTSGHLITNPLKKPSCIRMDRLNKDEHGPPQVVHYCSVMEEGSNKSEEQQKKQALYLELHRKAVEGVLQKKEYFQHKNLKHELRSYHSSEEREIAVLISTEGFFSTGLFMDIAQQALVLPTLTHHMVFFKAAARLEALLQYSFKNRHLLQRALTHPSLSAKRDDHLNTSLSNCGLRRPVYAKPAAATQRRGLHGLLNLGASLEKGEETSTQPSHNERLEFLGDAVVEYICSLHLFHLFPGHSVGQITIFRRALVKNRHLSSLASKLHLLDYMLAAPSLDLCTQADFSHAAANCLEAILGAVFLDSNLQECQRLFALLVFPDKELYQVWMGYPVHPLQAEYPEGDRHIVGESELLQKMVSLEQSVGVQFTHIRVLAKAFTHSSMGYTNLTRGDYQTMELLGDAVLQFLATNYVYHHFPHHHEGHLSFLRMALVYNKQLARVSSELGFGQYILTGRTENVSVSSKMMADVVESFLAALVIDQGLVFAQKFCEVCIFPKLLECSEGLNWLDAKSRLQYALVHTCRVQRRLVEMPQYRVVKSEGPANKRTFTAAVLFRGKRLAIGTGRSVHEADMAAAEQALKNKSGHIILPDALKHKSHEPGAKAAEHILPDALKHKSHEPGAKAAEHIILPDALKNKSSEPGAKAAEHILPDALKNKSSEPGAKAAQHILPDALKNKSSEPGAKAAGHILPDALKNKSSEPGAKAAGHILPDALKNKSSEPGAKVHTI